jgi:hypothetical protein
MSAFVRETPGLENKYSNVPIPDNFYEGLVVDVILDEYHPAYDPDSRDVGSIKVTLFGQTNGIADKLKDWAYPINNNIKQAPIIGEVVIIHRILDALFYTSTVPIAHKVQQNAMIKLNDVLNRRLEKTKSKYLYRLQNLKTEDHKFGKYFKADNRVRQLKLFEGDVLIQGRMGNSIRLGSSRIQGGNADLAPTIILRTGQAKNIERENSSKQNQYASTLEDINGDASSIWMTSDQSIDLKVVTKNAGSHYRSIMERVSVFNKASIILNSDRVVLSSKKSNIMLFSNNEIYMNSFKRASIDTDESIFLTANLDLQIKNGRTIDAMADNDIILRSGVDMNLTSGNSLSLVSQKIFLGFSGGLRDREPMVGGTSLSIFLARLLQVLAGTPSFAAAPQIPGAPYVIPGVLVPGTSTAQHTFGFTGVLHPFVVAGLVRLYADLVIPNPGSKSRPFFSGAPFNSRDNYVAMTNENPSSTIVKNNFDKGKSSTSDNNEWKLTKPYYKLINS